MGFAIDGATRAQENGKFFIFAQNKGIETAQSFDTQSQK